VKCNVAARLILTRLKLDDLLDAELMQLQQQELKYQRGMTLSGAGRSSPVIVCSQTPISHLSSTPVSRSMSATSSLPFELPDVNISDLLNTTIHSLNNVRSSMVGYQRTSSVSLPISPALSALSQRLSSTDSSSKKKASNRKKADENCRQNDLRKISHNFTANDKLSVTQKLTAGDCRKRQNSGCRNLAIDSDDEFEDSWSSSNAKKRVQEMRRDEQKADSRSAAAAAGEVVNKTDDESFSKRDVSDMVTDVTNSPASYNSDVCYAPSRSPVTPNGGSLQRSAVAQRLSKFAFNDKLLQQRQQLPASDHVTCVKSRSPAVDEQNAQNRKGNCCFLVLLMCAFYFNLHRFVFQTLFCIFVAFIYVIKGTSNIV